MRYRLATVMVLLLWVSHLSPADPQPASPPSASREGQRSVLQMASLTAGQVRSGAGTQKKKPAPKDKVKATPAKKQVATAKPEEVSFPDGTVDRRYDFVFLPAGLTAPYRISLVSGRLPTGLTVNQKTGGIEGEAKQAGEWKFTLQVVDGKGQNRLFTRTVRIWRVLTVGEHGQLQGFDGLQMALNMAQDMDEIRIERGTIQGSGLVIPQNKVWQRGIKISEGAANFGAHNIMGDPRFVDPDNGNLRLRMDSPAIDKGKSTLPRAKHDRDGKPRMAGKEIDMGAYEWQRE